MPYSDLNQIVGKILQDKRTERKMSQKELGERLGYSQSEISRFENGQRELGAIALFSIADTLNVDANAFNPANPDNPFDY